MVPDAKVKKFVNDDEVLIAVILPAQVVSKRNCARRGA
jgi:hypothetical protein